jgi:hypothetical protein
MGIPASRLVGLNHRAKSKSILNGAYQNQKKTCLFSQKNVFILRKFVFILRKKDATFLCVLIRVFFLKKNHDLGPYLILNFKLIVQQNGLN